MSEARRMRRRSISMTPEVGDDIVRLMFISLWPVLTLWFDATMLLLCLSFSSYFDFDFCFVTIGVIYDVVVEKQITILYIPWLK
jgi:hypothetical protein